MSVSGILISLLLLIWLAYRDISVLILAPCCALLAVALDGNVPILAAYTQIFMGGVGQFIRDFFPLFLLGAIFGKLMEDSGAAAQLARTIAALVGSRRTVLAVVLSCAVLTYGGVSLFVVVFTVFPLARSLFSAARIPARLIPGTIALGSFTLTMTALPGTIQIQNQIPMPFFRTTSFAAPGLGLIGGLVMLVFGMVWLNRRVAAAGLAAEFDEPLPIEPSGQAESPREIPVWRCISPLILAVALNFVFSQYLLPRISADYLAEELYGKTSLNKVVGTWSSILSLTCAILFLITLHFRTLTQLRKTLANGAQSALLPLFNTASEFGYGTTIRALSGFAAVQKFVTELFPNNPLVSEAIAVNSLAAMTGSASGGLSIAMNTLGETYYQRGIEAGVSPELLHRVASMSCGGLDSLPHNGAVITLLLICGMTHRKSYLDIGMVTAVGPVLATIVVITLGTLFGSF